MIPSFALHLCRVQGCCPSEEPSPHPVMWHRGSVGAQGRPAAPDDAKCPDALALLGMLPRSHGGGCLWSWRCREEPILGEGELPESLPQWRAECWNGSNTSKRALLAPSMGRVCFSPRANRKVQSEGFGARRAARVCISQQV